jgi:2-aminoethylphosphonate-pyruvate transaminase
MILLTPGPCRTSETVRLAAAGPDLNHREPEFLALLAETKDRLCGVYPSLAAYRPYLLGGSGTAAMEAMVTSCVAEGPVLVLDNGYYSERMDAILGAHGIRHRTLAFDWRGPIDLGVVQAALAGERYEAVYACHHETTTGRLNPIAAIGELARGHGARLLVDATSSFGADPIEDPAPDALCAAGNKCLHGIPGVAFAFVREDLAAGMESHPRRTYYLHLPMYGGERPPLTPPVPGLAALRQALRELEAQGGRAAREARYRRHARVMRHALEQSGMPALVADAESSCALVTAALPAGWSYDRWFEANHERGYVIYGCKGPLADSHFQVSPMGELEDVHIDGWVATLRDLAVPSRG